MTPLDAMPILPTVRNRPDSPGLGRPSVRVGAVREDVMARNGALVVLDAPERVRTQRATSHQP